MRILSCGCERQSDRPTGHHKVRTQKLHEFKIGCNTTLNVESTEDKKPKFKIVNYPNFC